MTGDFVSVIRQSLGALDGYRDRFRVETDDLSTLLVGPPEELFTVLRDLFVAAARTGTHVVLSAAVSRGCPGEPDEALCTPSAGLEAAFDLDAGIAGALAAVKAAGRTYQDVSAQFSYYPLGDSRHMDEIYACIGFLKSSGVFDRSKNFCTKLKGDAGPVFATLSEAFLRFAPADAHLVLDITVSANSPSAA